jgi:hypothetical protein
MNPLKNSIIRKLVLNLSELLLSQMMCHTLLVVYNELM